jgi:hypothetical protein
MHADYQHWVRAGCELWAEAPRLQLAQEVLLFGNVERAFDGYNVGAEVLAPVFQTDRGRRLAGLWGCLVAWHAPAGDGSGPMGRTWADPRVLVIQRWIWWWSLHLAVGSQAKSALRHAETAQFHAVGQKAAALHQAEVVGGLAKAQFRQAGAAAIQEL